MTIHRASAELGCARVTLEKALLAQNSKPDPEGKYSLRDLFTALAGDLRGERLRLVRLRADSVEYDLSERRKDTIPAELAASQIRACNARARGILDAKFKSELPSRCGGLPSDRIAELNAQALAQVYEQLNTMEIFV